MKFAASKRRAKYLDPEAKIAAEPIDASHPEWGVRHIVRGKGGQVIGSGVNANQAWKHASRRLDRDLFEQLYEEHRNEG